MLLKQIIPSLALASSALAETRSYSTYQPSLTDIELAAATAQTNHITSNVKGGKLFDRFVVIWLENTDYDKAYDNDDMKALLQEGIVLTNYWGLSHPSQENYIGAVTGDYLGLGSDDFVEVPANVSSLIDLLEYRGISWAEYQEHMPYTGYEGFQFKNQETGANDYVRKHNPVATLQSVSNNPNRLANVKNFTEFYLDLDNKVLPQWMFITPNMTNDGHDTTIGVASNWARNFLTPLLNNSYFSDNTLVLLTFDETETYSIPNNVYALLLGGVIEESQKGTEDDTFYDHYSEISTVEDNWDLPHLGRYDVDANVFKPVADRSGWKNKFVNTTGLYNNESYDGYFSDDTKPLPVPNVTAVNQNGQHVLPEIAQIWGELWVSQVSSASAAATATTTGTSTATSTSPPSCTDLGKSPEPFLTSCGQKFGNSWSQQLTNPSSIKNPSTIPVCVLIEDGEEYIETILSYFEKLLQNQQKGWGFKFAADSNLTSNSTTSASSSSSANNGNHVGVSVGALFGAAVLLLQMI